jgi:hypothetical protein
MPGRRSASSRPTLKRSKGLDLQPVGLAPGEPLPQLEGVQGVGPPGVASQERHRRQLSGRHHGRLERQQGRRHRHGSPHAATWQQAHTEPAAHTARHSDSGDARPVPLGVPRVRRRRCDAGGPVVARPPGNTRSCRCACAWRTTGGRARVTPPRVTRSHPENLHNALPRRTRGDPVQEQSRPELGQLDRVRGTAITASTVRHRVAVTCTSCSSRRL